jgi:4-methyl-5(b-hydroxyethyl)-thiazole monophosphate biosynthesis
MKKVILLLAKGFEEMEVVVPLDILRRGGISVDIVGVGTERIVEGGHQIALRTDKSLEECHAETYDLIIIPGGGEGVEHLQADNRVLELLRQFKTKGKWITAICAGPKVLTQAGVVTDSSLTSYPSVKTELLPQIKEYREDKVVIDEKLITSRGPGCAESFGFTLLETLTTSELAKDVKEKMLCS